MLLGIAKSDVVEATFSPRAPFALSFRADDVQARFAAAPVRGIWIITLDAVKGQKSLIGADSRFSADRYRQRLDGAYSIVAREPDGRVKIVRDRVGKTLRTFWGFRARIAGEDRSGWMELPPLAVETNGPILLEPDGRYRRSVRRRTIPVRDRDDRGTGFRAKLRDYHWSGTDGKAWVITFGDACPWRGRDVKLVFPQRAAWVPGYQLTDRHLVQFEFIETWGGGAAGCFEPMSDRLDRFGRVELLLDRADRKVLRWTYQLANPDYKRWGEAAGARQLPEVEELWTVFPDGTAVRRQRYWPVLDTSLPQHGLGNQVAELDVVWAADTIPSDVTPEGAATVFSPGQVLPIAYPSQRRPGDPRFGTEPVFGIAVHSRDPGLPDVFAVFDQARSTNPPYQISTDDGPDWHRERLWRFSHFPFNEAPFQYETNSQTDGRGQISHSSLVYVGAPVDGEWANRFRVDARGRKYREWTSVVGLAPSGDFRSMLVAHRRALARAGGRR